MQYLIACKQNNIENFPAILSDRNGIKDLTNALITLIIENKELDVHHEISCILGCSYNGIYHSPAQGGLTIPFTNTITSIDGIYTAEFVIIFPNSTIRIPTDNTQFSIAIYPSLEFTNPG